MGFSYLIGIVLAALSTRVGPPRFDLYRPSRESLPWLAGALVAGLVVSFGAYLHVLDVAAAAQHMAGWQRRLPFQFFAGTPRYPVNDHLELATVVQLLTFVQSALLIALCCVLLRMKEARIATSALVALGASAMAAEALRANVVGPDMYAYVGFAL
ncbi:MAG: hypothetical protein IAI49_09795, partial [Candidatus Eremiobacteraeota bacterium]|nr:hypothetical protein [Candidatus Eremiobacteraeota bacterium]